MNPEIKALLDKMIEDEYGDSSLYNNTIHACSKRIAIRFAREIAKRAWQASYGISSDDYPGKSKWLDINLGEK